ncbi:hypothetical protein BLNAU_1684 [Blattamonas nauphoetae]|uniref:SPRY domain-containing protein n=1 Tax=Blattamonas nauphoetae TaxID=2049346 RepID=A0ABQ9YHA5_9EUKA|nr:hypothetical protein BLNAU_1684 [Blattamonas nauphoetae]
MGKTHESSAKQTIHMFTDWPNECRTYSLFRQFDTRELPNLVQQLRNEIEPSRIIQTIQTFLTYVMHVPESAHLLVSLNIIPILTAFISQTNDQPGLSSVEMIASDLLHLIASRTSYPSKDIALSCITNPLESMSQGLDPHISTQSLHALMNLNDLDPLFPKSLYAGNIIERIPTLLSTPNLNPSVAIELLSFVANLIRNATNVESIFSLEPILKSLSNTPDAIIRDKAQTAYITFKQKLKTLNQNVVNDRPSLNSVSITPTLTAVPSSQSVYGLNPMYDQSNNQTASLVPSTPPTNVARLTPHSTPIAAIASMRPMVLPSESQSTPHLYNLPAARDQSFLGYAQPGQINNPPILPTMSTPPLVSQTAKLNVHAEDYKPIARQHGSGTTQIEAHTSGSGQAKKTQYSVAAPPFVPKQSEQQPSTPQMTPSEELISTQLPFIEDPQNQQGIVHDREIFQVKLPSSFHLLSFNPTNTIVSYNVGSIANQRLHGLFVPSTLITSGKWRFEAIFATDYQKRVGIIQSSFSPPSDYFPGKTIHSLGYSGSGVIDHQLRHEGNQPFRSGEIVCIEADLTGTEPIIAFFIDGKEQKMKVRNIPKEFRFCVYIHREQSSVKIVTLEEIQDVKFSLQNSVLLDWNDNTLH